MSEEKFVLFTSQQYDVLDRELVSLGNQLMGKMCGLIEIIGLTDKQETAAKHNLDDLIWGTIQTIQGGLSQRSEPRCKNGCRGMTACSDCPHD